MGTSDLIYYDEMKTAVDYYVQSPFYRGETLIPIRDLKSGDARTEVPIILGRNGHYHHYDIEHLQLLRRHGVVPPSEHTTLVLYDWHEDIDHDPAGTELGNGTWAYLGLINGLYSDLYVVGVNPRGFNELNMAVWDGETLHETTEETMRLLDRVYLFPLASAHYCLKLFEECVPFLEANPSVQEYFVVREGGFAAIRFKGVAEVSYRERQASVVVSIDLDVLRRSQVVAQCPQGAMPVDDLLAELTKLRNTGSIAAVLVCGLTEEPEQLTETSLASVARILSHSTDLLCRP